MYILDRDEKDEDRQWREAAILGGKMKTQVIDVTRVEYEEGEYGQYGVVFFLSPKGEEWKKNVYDEEALKIIRGAGRYEVSIKEKEKGGKTFENFVAPVKALNGSEPAAKAQDKKVLDAQRGMVFSSVVNATKDIVTAYISTSGFQVEKEEKPSGAVEVPTQEQRIIDLSRRLLDSLLEGVEARLNGEKKDGTDQ